MTDYTAYRFREWYIPAHMMGGIQRYIEHGIDPGHFLSAVIDNDLRDAVGRADHENLPAFVAFFHYEAPRECWGSQARRLEWGRRIRAEKAANA